MSRIVYVYVSAWAWIRCFNFLIAGSIIAAVESRMHCFLSDDFVLDVVLLLFMIIFPWSWSLCECLSSVRCLALMLPELASLSLCEE